MTRVFVLGDRGMLGHVVARYLAERGFDIVTTDARYSGGANDPLIASVVDSRADWVINTIGQTPRRASPEQLLLANAVLPAHLKGRLAANQRLLQASTDGVFSGRDGDYEIDRARDAEDLYGLSKILGESVAEIDRCCVLRCSIIGPERGEAHSLLGWLVGQEAAVRGFTNHRWNGITSLEWAKVAFELIGTQVLPAVIQVACAEPITKCQLLMLITQIWGTGAKVIPVEAADAIDRTLRPTLVRPPIDLQLRALRAWYGAPAHAVG